MVEKESPRSDGFVTQSLLYVFGRCSSYHNRSLKNIWVEDYQVTRSRTTKVVTKEVRVNNMRSRVLKLILTDQNSVREKHDY